MGKGGGGVLRHNWVFGWFSDVRGNGGREKKALRGEIAAECGYTRL